MGSRAGRNALRSHTRRQDAPTTSRPWSFACSIRSLRGPAGSFHARSSLDSLYADHRVVSDRTVDSHVKNLRRKLQKVRPMDDLVHSVYGVGYKLEL